MKIPLVKYNFLYAINSKINLDSRRPQVDGFEENCLLEEKVGGRRTNFLLQIG